MKRLLMATDLSARSDRALGRAVRLAREHGARLTVVHVVDEGLPPPLAEAQTASAGKIIREHVEALAEGDAPRVSIKVVTGRPHAAILDMAENIDAELVILGLHRADTLKDMFRGTTAERVLRAKGGPVLLVKERAEAPYGRIMVGVDFSDGARRAVEVAVEFASDAAFHLVHAYDVPFKGFLHGTETRREVGKERETQFRHMVERDMAAFLSGLEKKAPRLERVLEEGVVREVITRNVRVLKTDLLVIGTHGRTGLAHALLGSVAEDLLRDPPCDVLAVKSG